MSATERVAAFGSRSTISGWAAISPSPKSSRFAHHRVHRRLDYPASLGLDHGPWKTSRHSASGLGNSRRSQEIASTGGGTSPSSEIDGIDDPPPRKPAA